MNILAIVGLLAMVAKYLHGGYKEKHIYKHRAPTDPKHQFKGEDNG